MNLDFTLFKDHQMKKWTLGLGAFLLWIMTLTLAQGIPSLELDQRKDRLYEELRCPTCQGLSIKDSEATFSIQMREKVEELIQQGQSNEEIKAFFVDRYGEWILRSPPQRGLNWILWLLPGLLLILALFWICYRVFNSQRKSQVLEKPEALSAEEELLMAEDLNHWKRLQ